MTPKEKQVTKSEAVQEVKGEAQPNAQKGNINFGNIIGDIVYLMMRSSFHRHLFLSDLEWLLIPPVRLKQMRIFRNEQMPLAYISWAYLTEEAEQRLLTAGVRISPRDWNAGDRIWIIDNISIVEGNHQFLKVLNEQVFKGKDAKIMRLKKEGKGIEGVLLTEFLREVERSKEKTNSATMPIANA